MDVALSLTECMSAGESVYAIWYMVKTAKALLNASINPPGEQGQVTRSESIYDCGVDSALIHVEAGFDRDQVLEVASIKLASALDLSLPLTESKDGGDSVYGVWYLVKTAKALIDASINARYEVEGGAHGSL